MSVVRVREAVIQTIVYQVIMEVCYYEGLSCLGGASKIISLTSGCECSGKMPCCDGTTGLDHFNSLC